MKKGYERFRDTLRKLGQSRRAAGEMPMPQDQWGAWVNYRLDKLESRQTWIERLLLGALIVQVGLQVLGMLK